ncbi:MAG: hypothetical protein ACFB15_25880 [Cyclobacteriaceae bacterium]
MSKNNDKPAVSNPVIKTYDIASSQDTIELASDIANFIKEKKLFHHIQGKAYVNVEGWQYAGARLGILPIVDELENLSNETETKYQAKVRLLNLLSQQTVGVGFAICSNKENGKRNYQEFAIASMAQTRAIGKAYRNILAWIIRAAGYEPTPAEEMDYQNSDPSPKQKFVAAFDGAKDKHLSKENENHTNGYAGKPTQKKATDEQLKTINMILMQDLMKHDPLQQADFSNVNIKRASECIKRYNEVIELRKFIRDNLTHEVFDAQEKETIGNEYLSASKDVLKGIVDEMVYKIEKYDRPATRTANH